eukprot:CAMPEP_0170749682 /NCGR_PEP_ID=MMETSP0437-20130122/10523_1 /TAXON_ID=0 /ORGANISM="Sexangularia sp." /LENGTH=138 /DNA_ID=CAMNT_0011088617 /DNA_START=175 /DNA_END=591 /DNA_ORIENTATION=+
MRDAMRAGQRAVAVLVLLVSPTACQSGDGEGENDDSIELFGFPAVTAVLILLGGLCGLACLVGLVMWAASCRSTGADVPADFSLSGPSGFRHVSHVGRDHQNIDDIESIMGPSAVGGTGTVGRGKHSGTAQRSSLALV